MYNEYYKMLELQSKRMAGIVNCEYHTDLHRTDLNQKKKNSPTMLCAQEQRMCLYIKKRNLSRWLSILV